MKICHVIFSLGTGGTETMLVDIINEQVKTETVRLIIVNNIIHPDILKKINPGVQVLLINRAPSDRNPLPLAKINFHLFSKNPDIIHFHNVKGINLLLPCFRKKTVLTIHAANIQFPFLSKYKKLFAISKFVKKDIYQRYKLNAEVVYNGINTSNIAIKTPPKKSAIFRMVQIGRLDHLVKGQHLLIEAVKKLVYDLEFSNIQLDFIGEGASLAFLKQLVKAYHLEDRITFAGTKDRDYIYAHLCEYDLLLQPSLDEGFGLTIAEGMAAKVPVLVSDIEGPMEIIDNGNYGYYFETGNINDLTEKIRYILNNSDSESPIQMIENAYQQVINHFDVKQTAANYLKEYAHLGVGKLN
jgi:glycosyltransferase involved in cell wall biosynthesis